MRALFLLVLLAPAEARAEVIESAAAASTPAFEHVYEVTSTFQAPQHGVYSMVQTVHVLEEPQLTALGQPDGRLLRLEVDSNARVHDPNGASHAPDHEAQLHHHPFVIRQDEEGTIRAVWHEPSEPEGVIGAKKALASCLQLGPLTAGTVSDRWSVTELDAVGSSDAYYTMAADGLHRCGGNSPHQRFGP